MLALAGLLSASACGSKDTKKAREIYNSGARQFSNQNFESAIPEFRESARLDPKHHPSFHFLGMSLLKRDNPKDAVEPLQTAATLSPKNPLYLERLGVAQYKAAELTVREKLAREAQKAPNEVELDVSLVNYGDAKKSFEAAVTVEPRLADSFYFLCRIEVAENDAKKAADSCSKAIALDPAVAAPYITLAKLYLQWDYLEEAIAVTEQGAKLADAADRQGRSDILALAGTAYKANKQPDKAIDALTKALEEKKDNNKAKFLRGQLYFEKNDCKGAKEDLDGYIKAAGKASSYEKGVAQTMVGSCMVKGF